MATYIGVIGSGENINDDVVMAANHIGRLVAEKGAILVCGDRGGVMEAACSGAKQAGGITVGILPGLSRIDANKFVDIAIPTGLGLAMLAGGSLALKRPRGEIPGRSHC